MDLGAGVGKSKARRIFVVGRRRLRNGLALLSRLVSEEKARANLQRYGSALGFNEECIVVQASAYREKLGLEKF